ncbi:MAG: hypothetical protein R2744_02890 [Bacteroidales bacterium]
MMRRTRNILFVVLSIITTGIIISSFQGFITERDLLPPDTQRETQNVLSFDLPDTLFFAGERVPIENFDTRESLDREVNTNAYRHSSTILLIKRANRFFL